MKQFAAAIMFGTIGALAASVPDPAKPYISGEVTSHETFQYGRFVTKMQGSDRKGTLASMKTFWLGDENETFSVEGWNHINLELVPHQYNKVTTNLIWSGFTNWWDHVKNFDPKNDWHTYEITWTPDYISFSIDDVERRREEHTAEGENEAVADLNKKQHLILSFWTPEWAAEHLEDDSTMPWYTRYEYVEAYDYKGKDEETGEDLFELRFKDDFDNLDTERWALGNHSFDDNSATFVPENAYVEEGNLVLKMEKIGGSGPKKNKPTKCPHPKEPEKPKEPKKPNEPWQILPPPQPESLDRAIETTTRVIVTMVRQQLEDFSENMSSHLM